MAMAEREQDAYIELQREEWADGLDLPTRSHHFFSGVPYHHLVGELYGGSRLGGRYVEQLPDGKVV
jgi:hypothetical protein